MIRRLPKDGHVHELPATGDAACVHCGGPAPKERRERSLETLAQWHADSAATDAAIANATNHEARRYPT